MKRTTNAMHTLVQTFVTLSLAELSISQLNPAWSYDFTQSQIDAANSLARDEFPESFVFGVSTSSYQNEGAWNVSDKGLSVWDYALNAYDIFTIDSSNANTASDFYHKYKEDIQLAKSIGTKIFRISLNWPRILPTGFTNHISEDGVFFYNNLINELLANGMTPIVTLFHGEMPYTVHRLGSFLNPLVADIFTDYARVAFTLFGDRVKLWLTINEIGGMCILQNGLPDPIGYNLSGIMEYECFRNSLLAHANIYHMYKRDFASSQKGKVGLTFEAIWYVATTDLESNIRTAYDALQWVSASCLNAVFKKKGDYPLIVTDRVNFLSYLGGYPKSRASPFTNAEVRLIQGTADFVGLNFYHTQIIRPASENVAVQQGQYRNDIGTKNTYNDSVEDFRTLSTPWALREVLNYYKKYYEMPEIYITELGYAKDSEVRDSRRTLYFYEHLKIVLELLQEGFDIKGLLVWTLTDNFNWHYGYITRLGLFYVDYENATLPRIPKLSSNLVGRVFKEKRIKDIREMFTDEKDIVAVEELISSLNLS